MTTISSSITLTQTLINGYTWPVTISGGTSSTPTVVTLGENITLNAVTNYFIIGSQYVIFDGTNKTITLQAITTYPGLIQNGSSGANGYSNVTIKNFSMVCGTSTQTTSRNDGWITQRYFGKASTNNLVSNISTDGVIIGGGICGNSTGANAGSVQISDCFSTGVINNDGGGICGGSAGDNGGTVTISNCYSTGNITSFGGGITSYYAGDNGGTVTISNCYSTGNISGNDAGGICGYYAGEYDGTVTITSCYSTGNISGNNAGGIGGISFGYDSSNLCLISNCYSLGNVTGSNAGGIVGALVGYSDDVSYTGNVQILNSYAYGTVSTGCGAICGGDVAGYTYTTTPAVLLSNCYGVNGPLVSTNLTTFTPNTTNSIVGNGSWSDSTASTALTGKPTTNPIGTIWTKIASGYPWALSTFNANLYSPNSVTTTNSTYTSSAGILTGVSYNAFNSSTTANVSATLGTGVLNFSNLISGSNIASVIAYKGSISSNIYYGYNINTFTTSLIIPPTITTQPASQTVNSGLSVTFSVGASGSTPLSYQWVKNGISISGATSSTYTINTVSSSDSATYTVIVTNGVGSVTSTGAILTIVSYSIYNSPLIYTQPQSQIAKIGGRVVFQIYAYSLTPITYQWFFNDKPIEGANGLYLIIDPVTQANVGKYYVIVTNSAGSTKSSDVYLTISKI